MGNFKFIETKIPDLYIIEPKVFGCLLYTSRMCWNIKELEIGGRTLLEFFFKVF